MAAPMPLPALSAAVISSLPAAAAASTIHAASPSCTPTWTAASDEHLTTAPHCTRWASGLTARCALSAPARQRAPPLLARLPALAEPGGGGGVALVAVGAEFLHVAVAAGGLFECPLPTGLPRGAVFSRVFAAKGGLIVEVEAGKGGVGYWSLMHPLEEIMRIEGFGRADRVVFAGVDVGVVVTCAAGRLAVWGMEAMLVVGIPDVPEGGAGNVPAKEDVDDDDFMLNRVDHLADRGEDLDDMHPPDAPDDDEAPLPSQRTCLTAASLHDAMFRTGSADGNNAPVPSAFLAHSAAGELLLCYVAGGRLTALTMDVSDSGAVTAASPTFTIDSVAAAIGVMATRRAHAALDIAVLHSAQPGKEVTIYAGDIPMCSLDLPENGDGGVIGFRDAVGCRVTAALADGSAVRLSFRAASSPSALVTRCLGVISLSFAGVDEDSSLYPALDFQRAMLARALPAGEDSSFIGDPDERDSEWLIFVDLLAIAFGSLVSGTGDVERVVSGAPRRGAKASVQTGSDWQFLLGSEHHRTTGSTESFSWCSASSHSVVQLSKSPSQPPGTLSTSSGEMSPKLSASAAARILESLHLLYEDMKLSVMARADRHRLASCLLKLAGLFGSADLSDYYGRDFVDMLPPSRLSPRSNSVGDKDDRSVHGSAIFEGHARVPSLYDWLSRCVQFRQGHDLGGSSSHSPGRETFAACSTLDEFPVLCALSRKSSAQPSRLQASWLWKSPLDRSEKVMRYYSILFSLPDQRRTAGALIIDDSETNSRPQRTLRAMCADGFGPRDLDALSFGVALPLREALWACRVSPGDGLPSAGDVLVGREDLWDVSEQKCSEGAMIETNEDAAVGFEYRSLLRTHAASAMPESVSAGTTIESLSAPKSRPRQHGEPSPVTRNDAADGDDDDGCEMSDSIFKLRFANDRRISEVRRLLRSTEPVVVHLASLTTEDIERWPEGDRPNDQPWLLDRMTVLLKRHFAAPVGRGAFTLRTFTPTDPTMPLSVPALCLRGKIAGQKGAKLTFTPESAPYRIDWGEFHNGVAAGLRLVASGGDAEGGPRDGVSLLTRTWIVNHRPSDKAGNASHAGMLLALGLGGYLPALRATDYYEYLVPMHDMTTIGLMLGVAAGNRGSLNAKITKMLCVHIRHFNGPGFAVPDFHVSLVVQAAAVLGIGLLYQGTSEHLIMEGLLVELSRRPQPGDAVQDRECLSLAAGFALGLVCLGVGESVASRADLHLLDTLTLYAIGGMDPSGEGQNRGVDSGCAGNAYDSHFGGDSKPVNGDAGAVPPTAADSETSRVREGPFVNVDVTGPGALLALALIYLKSNNATVADRIRLPGTMYALDRARPDHVYLRSLARHLIMWDSIEASREWILSTLPDLLMPPFADLETSTGIDLSRLRDYEDLCDNTRDGVGSDIDEDGILLARAFAIAGACTAIALRFAGSMNKEALKTLVGLCVRFEAILERQEEDNEEAEWVYATCLNTIALAISVVAAGSGDLDMLRLLRRVRKRSGPSLRKTRYGTHMANHMAVGFLFLGGGCLTFGTSNIAVASLLCAIYPRFPNGVEDNQYHLQAMRHLYVLAVEPRCIEARDVDTDLPCSVDVEINLKADKTVTGKLLPMTAPCLLPDVRSVESVSVVSERYWPKVVSVRKPSGAAGNGWFSSTQRQVLYVKRRAGHLPHDVDPTGSKGMLARSFGQPRKGDAAADHSLVHLVKAFSADPKMRTFVGHFCESLPTLSGSAKNTQTATETNRSNAERYGEVLYECLSLDKPEAVQCYLEIDRAISAMSSARACPATVGSLALLSEYAGVRRLWGCVPLVRKDYLWRSILQARAVLDTASVRADVARYILDETFSWADVPTNDVGRALQLYRVPNPSALKGLRHARILDEDDSWVVVGTVLPANTPADAVELIARVLTPPAKMTN